MAGGLVAYLSLEFAVDERLPVYAGGLGVLAGDHLKAASDLGVPLVGVGLLYRRGYFRQEVSEEGRQREVYETRDPAALPLEREDVTVRVELEGGPVEVAVWRADVGSVPLFLLDTNLPENPDWARAITDDLYGGGRETRIAQELVLGIGGVRALEALGLSPSVFHLNEGHAAFAAVERLRALVDEGGLAWSDALEEVRRTTVFTTHTPVPAGNEVFDEGLVRRHLEPLVARVGVAWDELAALGRTGDDGRFELTPFALRTAAGRNAVSRLHGEVARAMWAHLGDGEAAIGHVTNGVHPRTWLAEELAELLEMCGVDVDGGRGWELARGLDLEALGRVRRRAKEAMLGVVGAGLDPDALTIGFARRFAPYKRAWLLFSQPERLEALLHDAERPLQVVLAGKAHPADEEGKGILAQVVEFARRPRGAGRVVFVADYDMALARALVQGADVWLNVPRRGEEASGTSGMKAALNGALNLSVMDGWWDEGYDASVGWAIPGGLTRSPEQDAADAEDLFRLLEEEVLPRYDAAGDPWLTMSRSAIAHAGERFTSHRMVAEYAERYYALAD